MKVQNTAALTAVWRSVAGVESESIKYVGLKLKILGCIMGFLDKNSVDTIAQRTLEIDRIVKEINPKYVVEIGSGFSCRSIRFKKIKFYDMDLNYFSDYKKNLIAYDAGKDSIDLKIKNAVFIVEGVTMYLQKKEIEKLLKEIKKYKGHLVIDFLNAQNSTKKTFREKVFKYLFKIVVQKENLFEFRIKNVEEGISILEKSGYRNVRRIKLDVSKTLDELFYAEL